MEPHIIVIEEKSAYSVPRLRAALLKAADVMGVENSALEAYVVGGAFMEKNVLAYPAPQDFPRPDLQPAHDLGELYINPEYIASHGEDFDRMAVHGFLHLLGYDHAGEHDTMAMEEKEREILRALGRSD